MTQLDPELVDGLIARAARSDFPRFEQQLRSSGYCARPVRLRGRIETCDGNGQRRVWSTDTEPDGILRKACGNRREAVCRPCAERYRGDAYQLLAAGMRGGKGVPDSVVEHPVVFFTLTAPSFGPVHARRLGRDGHLRRCRPRRDAEVCEHGVPLSCGRVHAEDDPCLGEPLCPDCFDHRGAVVWNNHLGELWRYTGPIYLLRALARRAGITQTRCQQLVKVAYAKVAEYQKRGLVHLHVIARLDRAMPDYRSDEPRPPDKRLTGELLEAAIRDVVADVTVPIGQQLGGGRVGWGTEFDVRQLDRQQRREIASYLAKYATKSTEQAGGVLHPVTEHQLDQLPVREQVRSYMRAGFALAREDVSSERRFGPNAHTLGYRGHCLTKSRRYSTTFKALREARERHVHEQLLARSRDATQRALTGAVDRVPSFHLDGIGHLTSADAFLAESAHARARERRRVAREEGVVSRGARKSIIPAVHRDEGWSTDDGRSW